MSGPNSPRPLWTRRQFFWRVLFPTFMVTALLTVLLLEMVAHGTS